MAKRAFWLPEHAYLKWPPEGTEVIFVHQDRLLLSGLMTVSKHGPAVKVGRKVYYPYLSTIFPNGSSINTVTSTLV